MGGHSAVKLVLVDVDGTLVGKDGVPPCVWPRVEALRAKGVRLSLITGRPVGSSRLA
jgi:hydroxymethylpyrimidine pyrophosphatase-like HAD family hydrolase